MACKKGHGKALQSQDLNRVDLCTPCTLETYRLVTGYVFEFEVLEGVRTEPTNGVRFFGHPPASFHAGQASLLCLSMAF